MQKYSNTLSLIRQYLSIYFKSSSGSFCIIQAYLTSIVLATKTYTRHSPDINICNSIKL